MLKIFVENTDHADATVPIRWCVDRNTIDKLKEFGATRPHILFSIMHGEGKEGDETRRYLAPLQQALTYIQFDRSGNHTVNASIVWLVEDEGRTKDILDLEDGVFSGLGKRFSLSLYSYMNGEFLANYGSRIQFRTTSGGATRYIAYEEKTALHVNVGSEFFAAEPPKWEQKWVNLWFEGKPRDQCAYRRRRIVAYTVQPPLLAFWIVFITLVRLIYAVRLLLFAKRCNLAPLIHPLRMKTGELRVYFDYWRERDNFILTDSKGKDRHRLFMLLHPVALIFSVGLLAAAYSLRGELVQIPAQIPWKDVVGVAVTVVVGLSLLAALINFLAKRSKTKEYEERAATRVLVKKERKEKARADEVARHEAELLDVVCCTAGDPPLVRIDALPKRRQTIALRWQDRKAKVCRPFASK